jgi:hypothetical protein
MRQQYLADGIENFDFHIDCSNECAKLSDLILSGDYVPSRPQRILVEKSKGLCRQLAIPSVTDALVLQCLSDALFSQIKTNAPTTRSFFEPKNHNFSQDKSEYGTFAAWLRFQRELFTFSRERPYVVVSDIANYYDSISYVHLRNVIAGTVGVEESILDMLIFVLSGLLWQPDYSPRVEIGLPQMNLDAPRLLAHCFLYELDKFLASNGDIDFVRYMDDIDVGVNNVIVARKILQQMDLVLQTRQVRLNSGKTQILTRQQAAHHFRIHENAELDTLTDRVEERIKSGRSVDAQRRRIEREIKNGLRRHAFDSGNGDKILKRLITLAVRTNARITERNLFHIILHRPSVRESALNYIMRGGLTPSRARLLAECVHSGHLVDEASLVEIANNLVETRVSNKRGHHEHLLRIIGGCAPNTYFGLYCRLWLQSKYDNSTALLGTIRQTLRHWAPHERLGRLIGALSPLFSDNEHEEYVAILRRSGNLGALATHGFHRRLRSDKRTFNAMFEALRNPNPSRGTGITHAKFLCLLSALRNPHGTERQLAILEGNNKNAFTDAYYRRFVAP